MINNYNKGTIDEQVSRVQSLMGINKPVLEKKNVSPLGTIEKTQIGKDGICYGIVKENNKYYLKKSSETTDVKLDNFEYLGGSHRYKHLYELASYNMAEKVLNEFLINVSKDTKKQTLITEQAEKIDMNLAQTVTSKLMREEIERQRQIMTNASAILNEDAGIKNTQKLNELNIDDEQILVDDTEGDVPVGDEEVISLDDEMGDEDLGVEDLGGEEELTDLIPDLLSKIDDLSAQLQQLTDDDVVDDEFEIDDLGDDDEFEVVESVELTEAEGNIDTMAANVTKQQFGYDNVQGDPKGRNEIPDYNESNMEIGPENMHTDTLDDVNSETVQDEFEDVKEVEGKEVNETQDFDWKLKGKGGENIAKHPGNEIKRDVATPKRVNEGRQFYVVERDGTVHGTISETEFKVKGMMNGKKVGSAKGGATPEVSKPFEKKVQQLTDNIFKECVEAGIFKKVKK